MIDPEFAVFNAVVTELKLMYPDVFATGDVSSTPAKFPAVSIVEISNTVVERMRTRKIENAVAVAFEVNVYSNKIGYSKMEAKEILSTVDGSFEKLGFTRTLCNQVQNLDDSSIYRMVARYEAVIDGDNWIYQN